MEEKKNINVNSAPKVRVKNLTKKFGELLVLDDISFEVADGEFLCVVGPTGCGKTTFLNSMTKLFDITLGEILIDDEPVNLRKHNIAYIFQEYSTMPWLTVEKNVSLGLEIKHLKKPEIEKRVNSALDLVGLQEYRKYYPNQLSVSMIQRVVIARAFATQPDVLLMDEPYGQLDSELRFKLEDELIKLWEKTGVTVVFITHNVEEAVYLSQKILVLTNKPTKIKEFIHNEMPHPRDIASDEFVDIRKKVTELIKWW